MNEAKTQNCGWCGATQTHENTKCFNCDHKLDQTKAAPAAAAIAGSSSATLLAAVADEVEALEKEIELMKLRVSECTDSATEQTLRNFGSCLWRHKNALVKAIAANSEFNRDLFGRCKVEAIVTQNRRGNQRTNPNAKFGELIITPK